jgi:ornithine cyclodeaminase
MTILTALRTAATSAMAAKYLAPKGADTMAIIGNGAQSEFQAMAFKAVLGINKLRLYDLDPNATTKCARNLAGYGFEIAECATPEEAVSGAHIITTVTADKKNATILTDNMVGAGVHINAVGGDCPGKTELHKDVVLRSDIFVEYPPQTWIEGEIQQLDRSHPVNELWKVIAGQAQFLRIPLNAGVETCNRDCHEPAGIAVNGGEAAAGLEPCALSVATRMTGRTNVTRVVISAIVGRGQACARRQ